MTNHEEITFAWRLVGKEKRKKRFDLEAFFLFKCLICV